MTKIHTYLTLFCISTVLINTITYHLGKNLKNIGSMQYTIIIQKSLEIKNKGDVLDYFVWRKKYVSCRRFIRFQKSSDLGG